MAERKSRLNLNSFLPVTRTHDEVVRSIFSPGRFACTITGSLQLVGIVSLCANLAIIIVADYCPYHPCNRKLNIGSAVASISCATALYFIFCCGYVMNNPSLWVRISILTNLTLSIITIVAQSMAMKVCLTITGIHKSPGPIALVGGGCLLLSCFCLFLLYRYRELDVEIVDILTERKISEDRTAAASAASAAKRVSFSSNLEDSSNHNHISGHVSVKYENDKRKCSVHSDQSNCPECHGGHGRTRKKSVDHGYRRTSHCSNHSHNSRTPTHELGNYVHHKRNCALQCKRKFSNDRYDEDYPQCFKGRRKNSLYAKHI